MGGAFFRYLLATGFSWGLAVSIPIFAHEVFGIAQNYAVALGIAAVFLINFFVIRSFVFRSRSPMAGQVVRFAIVALLFRGLEYALFLLLSEVFSIHYIVSLNIALVVSFFGKFTVQRRLVYRVGAGQ